ncbi:MAG: nucleoside kinase [Bacillota bacterium]
MQKLNPLIVHPSDPEIIYVNITGSGEFHKSRGISVQDLLKYDQAERKSPVVAAKVNNVVRDLQTLLEENSTVEFLDMETEEGMRVYRSSLILVLVKSVREILPGSVCLVQHSLGNSFYGEITYHRPLKETDIVKIEDRMRETVDADEPIIKQQVLAEEFIRLFAERGRVDKIALVKQRKLELVDIHTCGWFIDYAFGPMVPSTGYLKVFRLRFYLPGFILEFPWRQEPLALPEYLEQGKLANVYFESKKWNKIINIPNVTVLNEKLAAGSAIEFIRVAEAFHEKKISRKADIIANNIDLIRIVLIAGPSSSGKTTFTRRLSIQLRVNDIHPVPISMDNYFVNRELTPLDENGNYDFESVEALDYALFNEHLTKLIQGEEVEIPTFNFKTGQREWLGHKMKLGPSDLIVVEGIHGLNDKLTRSIPKGRKYKIYVSALTQLNLDNYNRIPTTDVRILRRIVRDNRSRGYSALETIRMWPSVRRGEEKYIFPFQETADIMFDSSQIYELAVLKPYAEPLLAEITPDRPEYAEARRLLEFLSYFVPIDEYEVPRNSILREFIGSSCFM